MRRIGKILCPFGSSEYSLKAREYALSLAQRDGAKHFFSTLSRPPAFTCPCYAFPDPINEVFQNLETRAGQGRQGFGHFTMGAVARKVLRKAFGGAAMARGGICESPCPKLLN